MSGNRTIPEKSEFHCTWKCGVCVAVCPEGAISTGSERLVIDNAACSGCLICVKTCPAGVIEEDLFA